MPIPDKIAGVKWQWWALGGIASGGVIWWAYKRRSSKAAAPTDGTAQDPSIDPTTGLPYASEMFSGATGGGPSFGGIFDPSSGATIGTTGQASQVVTSFNNAAEWGQAAYNRLIATGYDAAATATAIGIYVTGGNLSNDQLAIIEAAIGQTGYPPGSIPPPHTAPPAGQPAGGVTDGWYRDAVTGAVWQVVNGERHHLKYSSWVNIQKQKIKLPFVTVYPTWIGYKLPQGSEI